MPKTERIKSINAIAKALLDDGYIGEKDIGRAKAAPVGEHPISALVGLGLSDLKNGGRALTGETLGEWWPKK